jgi:S1-C subfamily serine protease
MTESPGPQPPRVTDRLDWARQAGAARSIDVEPVPEPPTHRSPRNESRKARGPWSLAAVAGIAALFGAIGGAATATLFNEDDADGSATTPAASGSNAGGVRVEVSGAIAEAAAKGHASVVRIESRARDGNGVDVGSGVVIDNDGHIVTNAHVVLGTDSLRVFLPDGREQQAILVGHDAPFTDVAVLQVAPGAVTPLDAGDSDALMLGETVVAVGNPLSEFAGSVSVGVVSGLNRVRYLDGMRYDDLVQTDAALNNGNSGGALVNLAGQFVAMPTAVLRETAAGVPVSGIGFAIPSNRVMAVARAIIENGGPIARASLAAEHVDVTAEVARSTGLGPDAAGALITAVVPGGPADLAGLLPGDVITTLGGMPVDREHPLLNVLAEMTPDESVTVVFERRGRVVEAQIRPGRRG